MTSPLKNPFGLKNGVLVTVDEVPSGLACGCVCPTESCGALLIAKHCGPGRESHFAHYMSADCEASYESAVHLLAKDVLKETKAICLPYLDVESSERIQVPGTLRRKDRIVERRLFRFDDVQLEVWMDGRVPDVVLFKNDRKLLVEIVVSHEITRKKLEWIREHNLAVVQVNLGWAIPSMLRMELKNCLKSGYSTHRTNIVGWVHHPELEETRRRLDGEYLASVADGTVVRPKLPEGPTSPLPKSVIPISPEFKKQKKLFD